MRAIPRSISIFVSPASTEKRCTVLPSSRLIRSRASSQTARISFSFADFLGSSFVLLQFGRRLQVRGVPNMRKRS